MTTAGVGVEYMLLGIGRQFRCASGPVKGAATIAEVIRHECRSDSGHAPS